MTMARTMAEPRVRPDTRALLLDAAERLFSLRGIEGASLREIAAAAGQRNNSAVGYHFRGKQALVDAVMADRVGAVERMRRALIDATGDIADVDPAMLLHLLWQPSIDIDEGRGGHWFVRFQLAYHIQYAGAGHPLGTDPAGHPASARLIDLLGARLPHLAPDRFRYRLSLVAMMFWSAVAAHDQAMASAGQRWSTRFATGEAIGLAVAALGAPA